MLQRKTLSGILFWSALACV